MHAHGLGMVMVIVMFWAVILGAGLLLLARLFPVAKAQPPNRTSPDNKLADPAVQVLRQRYASGEITKTEYEEVLRALE